ncbi:MAG: hypothetical protein PHR28_02610 [candidate division Zixibacteria bacterium]|nr:hypothetical protein [candidate division Zixibacteria bacterium]
MESSLGPLEERLNHFAVILAGELRGHTPDAEPPDAPPHIELIDFDDLRRVLEETMAALDAASRKTNDATVVRKWFAARIAALRRARHAFLQERSAAEPCPDGDDISLPTLLHCFEDESARWRALTAEGSRRAGRNGGRPYNDILDFKS